MYKEAIKNISELTNTYVDNLHLICLNIDERLLYKCFSYCYREIRTWYGFELDATIRQLIDNKSYELLFKFYDFVKERVPVFKNSNVACELIKVWSELGLEDQIDENNKFYQKNEIVSNKWIYSIGLYYYGKLNKKNRALYEFKKAIDTNTLGDVGIPTLLQVFDLLIKNNEAELLYNLSELYLRTSLYYNVDIINKIRTEVEDESILGSYQQKINDCIEDSNFIRLTKEETINIEL